MSKVTSQLVTYCLLTVGLNPPHVPSADPHQAVQCSTFAVQTRAMILNLAATVQHNLGTQRKVLHQHPSVIHHLALTLSTNNTA